MQQSTGALILACRSRQLEDFEWFTTSLVKHLRPSLKQNIAVIDIDSQQALIDALKHPPVSFQVSEIHLFAEFQEDLLIVSDIAGEFITTEDLSRQAPTEGRYPHGTSCKIWFWSETEHPSYSVLTSFQACFGVHFFLLPVSQLRNRLNDHTTHRRRRNVEATAPDATPVRRNRLREMNEETPSPPDISIGHVIAFTIVIGLGFSFMGTDLSTTINFEDTRSYTDETVAQTGDGELVRYQWVHNRTRWDYEWFIAKQWLQSADAELEQAAKATGNAAYWAGVYRYLLSKNNDRLGTVAASLAQSANRMGYDRHELATLVLSFVQHIPYKIPRNNLQLLTPPQTMVRRYGDCDSKSLLYVLLMRKLGYHVSMYISNRYRHAMAGIDVPASGTYQSYHGKRFYFVETTYPGHRIGSLPREVQNLAYWKIIPLAPPQPLDGTRS